TLGAVRVKINHFAGKPNPYRMNSPTASIAVRGTEFTITVAVGGDTQVQVIEGLVEVSSLSDPSRSVLLDAGRGVQVQMGQPFRLMGANQPPPGNRDADDRGPQQNREGRQEQQAAPPGQGNPPNPGQANGGQQNPGQFNPGQGGNAMPHGPQDP